MHMESRASVRPRRAGVRTGAAAYAVQGRHVGCGQYRAAALDGAGRRLLRRAGTQGRTHQYQRRQPRRGGIAGRPPRPHACRSVFGGAGQPRRRRSAADRLHEQRDPLRRGHRARREDRRRLQGWRHRRQHFRIGKRFHRHHRARTPRPHARRRHRQGIWRRLASPRGREVRRDQGHRDQRADHQPSARARRSPS